MPEWFICACHSIGPSAWIMLKLFIYTSKIGKFKKCAWHKCFQLKMSFQRFHRDSLAILKKWSSVSRGVSSQSSGLLRILQFGEVSNLGAGSETTRKTTCGVVSKEHKAIASSSQAGPFIVLLRSSLELASDTRVFQSWSSVAKQPDVSPPHPRGPEPPLPKRKREGWWSNVTR